MYENLTHQLTPFIAHGFLAIFGAFAHATKVYRDGGTRNFLDFTLLVMMSSFSGVIFALLGSEMFGPESYITLAAAGTGGFLGVEGMTFAVEWIKRRIAPTMTNYGQR